MVKLESVSFKYSKSLVLKDVNLEIHKGDYLGIIGANGSAKSTLIKVILGIVKPFTGKVTLFGEEQERFKAWSKIGYVRQNANVINKQFPASVYEIVEAGLYPFGRKCKDKEQRIVEALTLVGALDYKDALIGELSGGQQQKVFIARALISQPELLILDEATVGIDSESKRSFYDLLAKLNREQGMTIVMVSHEQSILLEFVNRIVLMKNATAIEKPLEQYSLVRGQLC